MPIAPLPLLSIPILPVVAASALSIATNSTDSNPPFNWESSARRRSTLNILFSCLTTLFLCAWTVLHLDVPTRKEGWLAKSTRKLGWFCVALFAPHILLVIAFNQRYLATVILHKIEEHRLDIPKFPASLPQRLHQYLRQQLSGCFISRANSHTRIDDQPTDLMNTAVLDEDQELNDLSDATRREPSGTIGARNTYGQQSGKTSWEHPWGMQHAFYACMGGYVFDFSESDEPAFLPCGDTSITITPYGIVWLMEHYPHLIPDIPVESIEDRSKSDALGKTLVVLQVLWFCTNLVARRASDLPISLLEISTLAHAINALLIYILWWDKPHDITLPTPITGPQAKEASALMSMLTPTYRPILAGLWTLRHKSEWQRALDRRPDRIHNNEERFPHNDEERFALALDDWIVIGRGQGVENSIFRIRDDCSPVEVPSERSLAYFRLYLLFGPKSSRPWYISPPPTLGLFSGYSGFPVKQVDLARWRLASDAVLHLEGPEIEIKPHRKHEPLLTRHSSPASFFRNLSTFNLHGEHIALLSKILEDHKGTLTISTAFALYGAPHLFGWSAQYPTLVERLLWKASVIALLSPIAMALLLAAFGQLYDLVEESDRIRILKYSYRALFLVLVVVGALVLTLYPAASAYLVVESFRQLFYLPDAAYDIPSWSEIWPHVS